MWRATATFGSDSFNFRTKLLTEANMGKNDLWIAATALYLDLPLHTADNDFDHLPALGLALIKEPT
ncbi:MAG: hypothetical protein EOO61_11845 [Hymenobacter sp.]|nr:MAG: hypothetical protein EOO61_11845 [Hymenobacter sp.]